MGSMVTPSELQDVGQWAPPSRESGFSCRNSGSTKMQDGLSATEGMLLATPDEYDWVSILATSRAFNRMFWIWRPLPWSSTTNATEMPVVASGA